MNRWLDFNGAAGGGLPFVYLHRYPGWDLTCGQQLGQTKIHSVCESVLTR